jgi:hypothetical protein
MSTALDRALESWANGDHYEAHEELEDFAESLEDERELEIALALVHVAASIHKAVNDVGRAAVPSKLERALSVLDRAPGAWKGLDLGALRGELRAIQPELEEMARGTRSRLSREPPVLRRV